MLYQCKDRTGWQVQHTVQQQPGCMLHVIYAELLLIVCCCAVALPDQVVLCLLTEPASAAGSRMAIT